MLNDHTMEVITELSESDANTSYPITARLWSGHTAISGKVDLVRSPTYGKMLFLDGELQSAEADEHIYHESLVHPVMASVERSARVLVVGGGEGATVREVLRWSDVEHVDWIDIDGRLVTLCEDLLNWAPGVLTHSRVAYIEADIRVALPTLGSYDVIILDLPDPDGDTGYLYSKEFFSDIETHLNEGGAIVTHVGPVRPYGGIGAGYQRLRSAIDHMPSLFYPIGIPSFQGDWGFMIWSNRGFSDEARALPAGLRVVDRRQLHAWKNPSILWSMASAF